MSKRYVEIAQPEPEDDQPKSSQKHTRPDPSRAAEVNQPKPEEQQLQASQEDASAGSSRATRGEPPRVGELLSTFIETSQYQQFVDVCVSCQRHHFIGVCYGEAGVGKTLSARRYTHWDQMSRLLNGVEEELPVDGKVAFFTPEILYSPKRLEQGILHLHAQMQQLSSLTPPLMKSVTPPRGGYRLTPLEWNLLVIDEADRLKPMGLEVLRDLFDRSEMGLMLIGMPGLEKKLARYPQFFSRVGFAHEYCALSSDELREILREKMRLVEHPGEEDLPAEEAFAEDALTAIIRMTHGNFRQMYRLLTQIERVLRINRLSKVTKAVVEAARSMLLFGGEEEE